MKKRDFETYQKPFRDFEILPKFSETHVFHGTIRHPYQLCNIPKLENNQKLSHDPVCTTFTVLYFTYHRSNGFCWFCFLFMKTVV